MDRLAATSDIKFVTYYISIALYSKHSNKSC